MLVAHALIDPEGAAARPAPTLLDAATLAGSASAAIATWGAAIHAADGAQAMAWGAASALSAAGGAWCLALPSLVVVGALTGSTLPWRQTTYATLVTVNFGGLCFLASVPIIALMEATWSDGGWDPRRLINALVLLGIGFSSFMVFVRTMGAIEGHRLLHVLWIGLFGTLFFELAHLFHLATF